MKYLILRLSVVALMMLLGAGSSLQAQADMTEQNQASHRPFYMVMHMHADKINNTQDFKIRVGYYDTPPVRFVLTVDGVLILDKEMTVDSWNGKKFRTNIFTFLIEDEEEHYKLELFGADGSSQVAEVSSFKKSNFTTEPTEPVIEDITPPVIYINGERNITIMQDSDYNDAGAKAVDGNMKVSVDDRVDSAISGTFTVTYTAVDSAGNSMVTVEKKFTPPPVVVKNTVIDLVVLHDRSISKTEIYARLDTVNSMYENSGSGLVFHIAKMLNYAKHRIGTGVSAGLDRITSDAKVKKIRDDVGADMVTLLSGEDSGGCGVAWMPKISNNKRYLKTGQTCFTVCGVFTWAHELGHNLGLNHSHRQENKGIFSYSVGHGVDGEFVTVMVYPSVFNIRNRIAKFSYPEYECVPGKACGVAIGEKGEVFSIQSLQLMKSEIAELG